MSRNSVDRILGGNEGAMTVRNKYVNSLLLASAVVGALISAPVASAVPTCQDGGSVTRCETSGSVSIKAVPTPRAPTVADINNNQRNRNRSGIVLSW